MRLEIDVPSAWRRTDDGRWLVAPDVVVNTSLSRPEEAKWREGLVAARAEPFATDHGWPAVVAHGETATGYRLVVAYEMLGHVGVAIADAPSRARLLEVGAQIDTSFAGARPRWPPALEIAHLLDGCQLG